MLSSLLFVGAPASSAEPEVHYEHGRYRINMALQTPMNSAEVLSLLTDYAHLDRVNPAIVSSVRRGDSIEGLPLVQTLVKGCILFFCKTIERLEKVHNHGDGRIEAVIVPQQGGMREGWAEWRIEPQSSGASIRYQAEFVPDFAVPPGIGPLLVKRILRKELQETAAILAGGQ